MAGSKSNCSGVLKKSHPTNQKHPSDPSSQEAYNQNRTEESKHRDSVLPPTKTWCCCGGGKVDQSDNPVHPQKNDGVNLFVDFGRLLMMDFVFCVCGLGVWWMALGWKRTIWDLGLVILKTISWSVVKHGFCGSGFDFWRLHQRGKHQEFQVGQMLQQSLIAKSNIYEYLIVLYFMDHPNC